MGLGPIPAKGIPLDASSVSTPTPGSVDDDSIFDGELVIGECTNHPLPQDMRSAAKNDKLRGTASTCFNKHSTTLNGNIQYEVGRGSCVRIGFKQI